MNAAKKRTATKLTKAQKKRREAIVAEALAAGESITKTRHRFESEGLTMSLSGDYGAIATMRKRLGAHVPRVEVTHEMSEVPTSKDDMMAELRKTLGMIAKAMKARGVSSFSVNEAGQCEMKFVHTLAFQAD